MTSGSQQLAQVPWYRRWVRGMILTAPGGIFALPGFFSKSLDGWLQSRPEWAGAAWAVFDVFCVAWLVVVPLIIYRAFTDWVRRWQGPG
jgi:hypothetical protein